MPVPKRKRSRQRRDKRFANKGVKVRSIATCNNCSTAISSHTACLSCGFYKGRKVLDTKTDRSVRRADNQKEKEVKQAAVRKKLEVTPIEEEPKKAE
ncbi:MAG: large subunit ribosomal protein L32 [Alteromonas naphthalenivorans]|jgi:large subunit ribosomal protein L32